jgi:hypothetical protein
MTDPLDWLREQITTLDVDVPRLLENKTWTNPAYQAEAEKLRMYKALAIEVDAARGKRRRAA